ncbi:MAG: hypothetical protein KC476_02945 [Cyanobacteria bacterium HKST-UBA06]|nr:hypothetical protein [Cyanobacteria bacterium HKST-UBA06]
MPQPDNTPDTPRLLGTSCRNASCQPEPMAFLLTPTDAPIYPQGLSKHLQQLADHPESMDLIRRYPNRLRRLYMELDAPNLGLVSQLLGEAGLNPNTLRLLQYSSHLDGHSMAQMAQKPQPLTCVVTGTTTALLACLHEWDHTNLSQQVRLITARIDFPEYTWLSDHRRQPSKRHHHKKKTL